MQHGMPPWFWSSDKLTGSQTGTKVITSYMPFWSSDKLTGSQTLLDAVGRGVWFWSSDKLTGSQTATGAGRQPFRFGAVTN